MDTKHAVMALVACLAVSGGALGQPGGGGPGMMGRYGGGDGGICGLGPGMMGGYGMGPGMMGGPGLEGYAGLELGAEQQKKITAIQQETSRAVWQLMATMREQDHELQGTFRPGALDEAAARKAFQAMQEARRTMFDVQLEAHKKIDTVLTEEQRTRLRR